MKRTNERNLEARPNKVPHNSTARPLVLSMTAHTPVVTVSYAERMNYARHIEKDA